MPLKNAYSEEYEKSSLLIHLNICNAKVRNNVFVFSGPYEVGSRRRYRFRNTIPLYDFQFTPHYARKGFSKT